MTLSAQEKSELARYRLEKAKSLLREFRVLQARRLDSDYGDYVEIRPTEAEDSLMKARDFVASAEKAMAEILKGQ